MQIYILDNKYELLGVIDEQEDIVFNKRFNDVGYAALKVACDDEMLGLLRRGNYIYRFDDDMFCKIETATIDTDVEQGDYLTVDAIDMNNILAGRIVRWEVVFSGTVLEFLEKLITDNVINPAQTQRKIANFELYEMTAAERAEFTETISVAKDTATQDLLQLIITTCKTYNYGFRVSYNINSRKLVFRLIRGKNKATTQSDEYVEFSPNYANILSSQYKEDESNYKNVVYVGYKTANEETALLSLYTEATEPQGEARREVYIDATNTSRDVTIADLETIFGTGNVTRSGNSYYAGAIEIATVDVSGEEEKLTATDYTYFRLIRIVGMNALAERAKTQEFSGEVDTIDTYEYKKDYDLGDIVKVENEYGISAAAQITEITESESADNPYSIEPKFEYIY